MPVEEEDRNLEDIALGDHIAEDLEFKDESEEAVKTIVPRVPGAPTVRELEEHNVTHLPHRSWCEVCVSSRARDKPHYRGQGQDDKCIPEVVFDYGFLGTKGESETQAIQIARDRRTQLLFAHHVPRKGLVSVYGAREMVKDLDK